MLTGGTARGRPLPHVPGRGVRPTAARVREAMFSMVGHDLDGVTVLDAFGGSGLLALEAWSRGAQVVCVERDRSAWAAMQRNVEAFAADIDVVRGDVLALAAELGSFDVVLADPPYADDPAPLVDGLAPLVADVLVLEVRADRRPPGAALLRLVRHRTYGGTALCLFRRSSS